MLPSRLIFLVCLLLVWPCTVAFGQSRAGTTEAAADYEQELSTLLQKVVTDDGLVRYGLLRGDLNGPFRRVLKAIENADPTLLSTDEQKLAFWINAYNVQMLQNIIETPSVRNIIQDGFAKTFFDTPVLTAGLALSLNDIEHTILRRRGENAALQVHRPTRLDPRLHVALNCAAVSCPRLRQRAFTATTLHEELEASMRDFAGSTMHFRVDEGRVVLSSLLDWYGGDFDTDGDSVGDVILRYMPTDHPGYDTLRQALAGHTSGELQSLNSVQFEYLWDVNAAE